MLDELYSLGEESGNDDKKYLHWDEFRHRISPKSPLSAEEQGLP